MIPPHVSIDGRLPDPAVATCNEPLPLCILVTKVNESSATLHLQLLQIELVAHTGVRAHHLNKVNLTSWIILSQSNMRFPLVEKNKVMELDPKLWNDIPLPNTVAPSFDTCNLTRSYSLDIKVGLSYGQGSTVYVSCILSFCQISSKVYFPPLTKSFLRLTLLSIHANTFNLRTFVTARTLHPAHPDAPESLQRHRSTSGPPRRHERPYLCS